MDANATNAELTEFVKEVGECLSTGHGLGTWELADRDDAGGPVLKRITGSRFDGAGLVFRLNFRPGKLTISGLHQGDISINVAPERWATAVASSIANRLIPPYLARIAERRAASEQAEADARARTLFVHDAADILRTTVPHDREGHAIRLSYATVMPGTVYGDLEMSHAVPDHCEIRVRACPHDLAMAIMRTLREYADAHAGDPVT